MPLSHLQLQVEALIFATDKPISQAEIKECLEEQTDSAVSDEELAALLADIQQAYAREDQVLTCVEIGGGFQFFTKGAYHPIISTHLKLTTQKRLSRSAMETLSIVAYKQPVTKSEIEKIRGVNCDYAIQKLLEKDLVAITGRAESPGRPLLYGTSSQFMDYFGISGLSGLPKLKDFKSPGQEIGNPLSEEE